MNRESLFYKTLSIIMEAAFRGTLSAEKTSTGPVAHILAADNGFSIIDGEWISELNGGYLTCEVDFYFSQKLRILQVKLPRIVSTSKCDYTPEELCKIEDDFVSFKNNSKNLQLSILISTLMDIHEVDNDDKTDIWKMIVPVKSKIYEK